MDEMMRRVMDLNDKVYILSDIQRRHAAYNRKYVLKQKKVNWFTVAGVIYCMLACAKLKCENDILATKLSLLEDKVKEA